MSKKLVAALGIIGFLSSAGIAFAQTTTSTTAQDPMPMILNVSKDGKALLRGTIVSVTSGSLTVTSWGGTWTVNVPSSAEVLPNGVALSSFQQGDFVGIQGAIDSSASWTVNATLIRDWTARQALTQQIKTNVQAARATMSSGPRVVQGTLSGLDVTGQTFTLTNAAGTAYTVTLSSGVEIIGKNWATIQLTQATNGDTVRVYGPVTGTAIAASVFRDVSVK